MVATLDAFHFDLVLPPAVLEAVVALPPASGAGGTAASESAPPKKRSRVAKAAEEGGKAGEGEENGDEEEEQDGDASEEEEEEGDDGEEEEEAGKGGSVSAAVSALAAKESIDERAAKAASVMHAVRSKLLPDLYRHFKDPKTDGVRVPVALAVLKLLLLMPEALLQRELHGFLLRIVETLSSRNKTMREVGRETLGKVVLELGAPNFGAVLHEMTTSLRKGFQIHVLGFSLHYLLAKLVPVCEPGALDYCAAPLVRALLADIFGEAAEKKEVDAIANSMKETRATKSFASFELLASVITFVPDVNKLIPPITTAIAAAEGGFDSLKNVTHGRELLRYACLGLSVNPTVELQSLCVYVCGLLNTHLPPKGEAATPGSSARAAAQRVAPVGSVLQPLHEPGVTGGLGGSPISHELLGFALSLLLAALRKGRFSPRDPAHLSLLAPLLPLLQRCLKSDSSSVVSLSLRTIGALLPFPLPSLPAHANALLDRTLQILRRSANLKGSELVGVGLKVVTALLRKPPTPVADRGTGSAAAGDADGDERAAEEHDDEDDEDDDDDDDEGEGEGGGVGSGTGVAAAGPRPKVGGGAALDERQLRWLLSFVSVHLEDDVLQSALFGLLRVILGRRFVLAELYDLVLVLGEMLLQSPSESVRSTCAKLFLTFLMHYPLGERRVQQHFNFLVTNLS